MQQTNKVKTARNIACDGQRKSREINLVGRKKNWWFDQDHCQLRSFQTQARLCCSSHQFIHSFIHSSVPFIIGDKPSTCDMYSFRDVFVPQRIVSSFPWSIGKKNNKQNFFTYKSRKVYFHCSSGTYH